MTKIYKISGMSCGGCVRSVEKALKAAARDVQVEVSLDQGTVAVEGLSEALVAQAIEEAGFSFEGTA